MNNDLTLEKLKVKDRLEKIEVHIKESRDNCRDLIDGIESLKKSVESLETTLFGEKGRDGLVKKIESIVGIANGIKWVLMKIFIAICSAITISIMPSVFGYISKVMIH